VPSVAPYLEQRNWADQKMAEVFNIEQSWMLTKLSRDDHTPLS
jgi:phage portal protein BeeE